jgi:hypothetical protein
VKREIASFTPQNERDNVFIFINMMSNSSEQVKWTRTSDNFLTRVLNILVVDKSVLLNKPLLEQENINPVTVQTYTTSQILTDNMKSPSEETGNPQNTDLITRHFNTLFRILSFIAFVLVLFSLVSLSSLVFFAIGYKRSVQGQGKSGSNDPFQQVNEVKKQPVEDSNFFLKSSQIVPDGATSSGEAESNSSTDNEKPRTSLLSNVNASKYSRYYKLKE